MRLTVKDLHELVGKNVEVIFRDGDVHKGVLGYTAEFSSQYGYRKPNYFTVGGFDFKVSHIKGIREV